MKNPVNPFPLTGYYGPAYFCDREKETKAILTNIKGGLSTILTARRRIGKTLLIRHVIAKLPAGTRGVYLDILPTENMNGFLNELSSAIIRDISETRGFGRKAWEFIKSLRPSITFDALTGSPQVTIYVRGAEINTHVESIFEFLEKQNQRFVIAIDEFQQILKYPEKNVDAWLRTIIQRLKNVVFIFSGSQQHLMNELFTIPSRPFYKSATMLGIGTIPQDVYSGFIRLKFSEKGVVINDAVMDGMMQWADMHTYYVQLICNRVYSSGVSEITDTTWKEEAYRLLEEQEQVFLNYRGLLTIPQWQLLKAVALEGEVYEPTGNDFIVRHTLGSPSTVLRSLQSLLKMELVYYDYTAEGRKYHKINDLLFRRWAESRET